MRSLSLQDRQRYAGCPDQLYHVLPLIMDEGRAHGTRLYDVKTGGGLRYIVTADTGMDIGEVNYRGHNVSFYSKNGYTSPYAHHPFENDFLHSFPGGMLYTSGLLSTGPANRDEDVWHPLHGRYHSLSPVQCAGQVNDENQRIEVSGRMRETALFGHALELHRTISSGVGENEIHIRDILTNQTPEPMEYLILYHLNFGYPFLSKELVLDLPEGVQTEARDEDAALGLGQERTFCEPIDGYAEQAFFHQFPAKNPCLRLCNAALGFGVEITWSLDTLPNLVEWKCMRSGDYALGIEPTNSRIKGRHEERKNGTISTLASFETRQMDVKLRFFDI